MALLQVVATDNNALKEASGISCRDPASPPKVICAEGFLGGHVTAFRYL
jgi:hypothetical protein